MSQVLGVETRTGAGRVVGAAAAIDELVDRIGRSMNVLMHACQCTNPSLSKDLSKKPVNQSLSTLIGVKVIIKRGVTKR